MTAAHRDHGIALEELTAMGFCCILLRSKASQLKTYYQVDDDALVFSRAGRPLNQFRGFKVAD
jgi:hypothetical protein